METRAERCILTAARGGTFYGFGSVPYEAGPSASARFVGDPLSAIFGSLTIQDQRTAGMAQQVNQVDERTQVIQQTQDEQYNRLLEIEATAQRTFDESQRFFQYYGYQNAHKIDENMTRIKYEAHWPKWLGRPTISPGRQTKGPGRLTH
ncbi:hypothetical protein U9M48_042713 [Paspalum notatum var. saurae]|uniref:Uncharacterized protein n=1 Tax=Paspalum notatum var. saurae TaxID=547442 RepID=A0AAQ3UR54_PASNO